MPVTARNLVRKMRGGAQAILLEADDGFHYVVKFQDNPQHRRILLNELTCSVFLRYLQLPTPEIAFVQVSEEFLRENPETAMEVGSRRVARQPGWQFGSKYPGNPNRLAVYDFLPDTLLRQVVNLDDFLGALVFDQWVSNTDARQAVFFRARIRELYPDQGAAPLKLGFVAQFIDNGYAFNGPYWNLPDSAAYGVYYRHMVYEKVQSLEDFQPWLQRITYFPEETVDQAIKQIPPEWIQGDADAFWRLMEDLMKRRKRLPSLVTSARNAKLRPFPKWK